MVESVEFQLEQGWAKDESRLPVRRSYTTSHILAAAEDQEAWNVLLYTMKDAFWDGNYHAPIASYRIILRR
jgi:hypothetical protein